LGLERFLVYYVGRINWIDIIDYLYINNKIMPKPYDLNLHKSYNVNNNDKNYKSFTDANGE